MKSRLLLILTLLLLSTPVFGELTNADLDKINTILKESEARMKEHVSQEIAKVNLRVDALDKRLTSEIRSVDKRFDDMNKRLDDMNKRLDDMNKRLDNQFTLILALSRSLPLSSVSHKYSSPYNGDTNAPKTRKLKHNNSKLKHS